MPAAQRVLHLLLACSILALLCRQLHSICLSDNERALEADYRTLPVGTVRWFPCTEENALGVADCGYIIVPTDYHDANAGVTKVALGRVNATESPRKGMVLFNPGGPGGSGKHSIIMAGNAMQVSVTTEHYDIIGFDPRGIGDTEPATRCFPPGQARELKRNTVLDKGFDVGRNLSDPDLRASLLRQQVEMDALVQTQYAMCGLTMGEQARYMGTTTVVRDMDFITTTLEGKDALINFYGGSYGSVVGQYLVNVFPDRIGKVVIEGIVDSVAWANELHYKWYRQWLSSTEGAYDWFVGECAKAGPKGCALAKAKHEDPSAIRKRMEDFFDRLYEKPLIVADEASWGTLTSGMARQYLLRMLQRPMLWPGVAIALAEAMNGDGKAILYTHSLSGVKSDMERQAVSCNDAYQPPPSAVPTNEDVVDEMIDVSKVVTKLAFSVLTAEPDFGCQYWPVTAPERFAGPWNHTLSNPILVLSTTDDPVTPISSARLVKKLLGDSAVLGLQNAPGHGTSSVPSICTINKSRAYFLDGILPEDGHMCQISVALFPTDEVYMHTAEEQRQIDAVLTLHATHPQV